MLWIFVLPWLMSRPLLRRKFSDPGTATAVAIWSAAHGAYVLRFPYVGIYIVQSRGLPTRTINPSNWLVSSRMLSRLAMERVTSIDLSPFLTG